MISAPSVASRSSVACSSKSSKLSGTSDIRSMFASSSTVRSMTRLHRYQVTLRLTASVFVAANQPNEEQEII